MRTIDERRDVLLPRPGPIGLVIRVLLGAASVQGLVALFVNWESFRERNPIETDFWLITLATVWLLPDVFNITLGQRWRHWPRTLFLAGAAAIALVGYVAMGEIWNPALAAWVYGADLLVMGALVASFPVAVATRSPGCELGAIPWLLARGRGRASQRPACVAGLDRLDRWESRRKKAL